jgi:hypothetical protein
MERILCAMYALQTGSTSLEFTREEGAVYGQTWHCEPQSLKTSQLILLLSYDTTAANTQVQRYWSARWIKEKTATDTMQRNEAEDLM